MSYSFTVRAPTAAAVLAAAAAQFDQVVVATQPPHKIDCDQALKNAQAAIELLSRAPKKDEEIVLAMHGGLGGILDWTGAGGPQEIESVSLGCNATISKVQAQA